MTLQPFTRLPTADPILNDIYDKLAVALSGQSAQSPTVAASTPTAAVAAAPISSTTDLTNVPSLTALPSVNPSSSPYARDGVLVSVSTSPTVPGTLYRYTAKTMAWIAVGSTSGASNTLAYAEITTPVPVTATSAAAANVIVTAPAHTFNGTTSIFIEFFAPEVDPASASVINIDLFEDGVDIGEMARISVSFVPSFCRRKRTPSAGSHIYSIRAWKAGSNGQIAAGAGGASTLVPAYIAVISY